MSFILPESQSGPSLNGSAEYAGPIGRHMVKDKVFEGHGRARCLLDRVLDMTHLLDIAKEVIGH